MEIRRVKIEIGPVVEVCWPNIWEFGVRVETDKKIFETRRKTRINTLESIWDKVWQIMKEAAEDAIRREMQDE